MTTAIFILDSSNTKTDVPYKEAQTNTLKTNEIRKYKCVCLPRINSNLLKRKTSEPFALERFFMEVVFHLFLLSYGNCLFP